jgi:hypothetical protein
LSFELEHPTQTEKLLFMAQTATPASRKPSARTRTAPKKPDEVVPPPQKNSRKKKATQASPVDDDEEYRIECVPSLCHSLSLGFTDPNRWTNELSHSLIAEITNSAVIKQGLFPAPGTKSQPSNTAVKNDYLWMLCEAVFEEHPDYEKVFPKIQSNAERKKSWTLKMKNKLAASVSLPNSFVETYPKSIVWSKKFGIIKTRWVRLEKVYLLATKSTCRSITRSPTSGVSTRSQIHNLISDTYLSHLISYC